MHMLKTAAFEKLDDQQRSRRLRQRAREVGIMRQQLALQQQAANFARAITPAESVRRPSKTIDLDPLRVD